MMLQNFFSKNLYKFATFGLSVALLSSSFSTPSWGMEEENKNGGIVSRCGVKDINHIPDDVKVYLIENFLHPQTQRALILTSKNLKDCVSKVPSLTLWGFKLKDGMVSQSLKFFHNFHKVNLDRCLQITDEGFGHLSGLSHLKSLNISACTKITDEGLSLVSNLRNLEHFGIKCCYQITDKGIKHISGLTNLKSLKLMCSITDEGFNHISGLTNLESLDLSGCHNITSPKISSLTKLEKISLKNCKSITDKGINDLSSKTVRVIR